LSDMRERLAAIVYGVTRYKDSHVDDLLKFIEAELAQAAADALEQAAQHCLTRTWFNDITQTFECTCGLVFESTEGKSIRQIWQEHIRALAPDITAKAKEGDATLLAKRIAEWRTLEGGPWDEMDVPDFKLLNEVWNDGFEAAHTLRACGHSVGDFRDPNYVIGKPETYTGKEKCVGCEHDAKIRREVYLRCADNVGPGCCFTFRKWAEE
jgi:hypothetical protein